MSDLEQLIDEWEAEADRLIELYGRPPQHAKAYRQCADELRQELDTDT